MRSDTLGRSVRRVLLFGLALMASPSSRLFAETAPAVKPPPLSPASSAFAMEPVGPAPKYRPTIANVQIVDLDRDKKPEILVCDAQRQAVIAYRRTANNQWDEQVLGEDLIAPAHATVVDLDGDGDDDVVVSVMGDLYPNDDVVGRLVLLENVAGKYQRRVLLDDLRRVVDAQPGDFDQDGDVDLAVAVFGYARGQVLWLENQGKLAFRQHELLFAPGAIHVPVADYDGDGDLDIAAIVSQEEEEVWGFENLGQGRFKPQRLWMTVNYDVGSAGLVQHDVDGDGDADLLLPLGDNLEDSYATPQPYHGCLWLENQGTWKFAPRQISHLPGTYAATAGDLDNDKDCDVVLCSMVNRWNDPQAPSLVWLENDGQQHFVEHPLACDPIKLVTVACGDLNGDKRLDLVAGGLHMHVPFDRMGRVNAWLSTGKPLIGAATEVKQAAVPSADAPADAQTIPRDPVGWQCDRLTRGDVERQRDQLAAKVKGGAAKSDDWLDVGQSYYAFGAFATAGEYFAVAKKIAPEEFSPAFWHAVSLSRLGAMAAAVASFEAALPHGSAEQQAWARYEIGRCQLRLENAAAAEQAFRTAGDCVPALAEVAKLCVRSERPAEAEAALDVLAQRRPNTLAEALLRRQLAEQSGDLGEVQAWRDKAEYASGPLPLDFVAQTISKRRNEMGANRLVEQARRLIQSRQFAEAAPLLETALAEDSRTDAIVMLAGCRQELGQHDQTIDAMQAMMDERGVIPVALLLLGDAQLSLKKIADAKRTWQRLEAIRAGDALSQRLAGAYQMSRDEAAQNRANAVRVQESGIAALRGGYATVARKELGDAVRRDPSLARGWFYLGEARRIAGDPAAARTAYAKAVELVPHDGRALDALRRLDAAAK